MTAIAETAADDNMLLRAQGGDHDAFAAIIGEYQNVVYGIAYNFLSERALAEEIAQDVFLQLYRSIAAIHSHAHLLHWLRQVTSRRCIDQKRRYKLRRVAIDDADVSTPPQVRDPLLARRLRERIATLPDLQRLILTLRYQEDLGPTDIGRTLGMPENTVKSYLHRALTALRKEFQ
jgi:RNA polymerase sigma-70 factor (ECF subfamily)